jgi:molybdopterin/thiamine biosynthesis adenylyltransferase
MEVSGFREYAAAFPQAVHESIASHLLQHIRQRRRQEDLCFALWRPSAGSDRLTSVIYEPILPGDGDRILAGNVNFNEQYFRRALTEALNQKAGLAVLHSHLGPGWQDLSPDDYASESSFGGRVLAATKHPFLGLTIGTDESWSGRTWFRDRRAFEPTWCSAVRVAGQKLRMSYHPKLRPVPKVTDRLTRTIGVWGREGQANLARLHVAVVGLGSVGSIIAEELARLGIENVTFIDFDVIEALNLDRVLNVSEEDIERLKVEVAADAFSKHSTAAHPKVRTVDASVAEEAGYSAMLDADVIFSCVDRHLPRRVLNHVAYAHCIPVIDGGILVRLRRQRLIGADWHIRTVAPGRRCLECAGAYDPSVVGMEQEGLLDDPSYLAQLDQDDILLRHENVFPFSTSVAAFEILQLALLLLGPIHNLGDQNYHFVTGALDKEQDRGCETRCLFPALIGSCDSTVRPVITDIAAEKARRARGKVQKKASLT